MQNRKQKEKLIKAYIVTNKIRNTRINQAVKNIDFNAQPVFFRKDKAFNYAKFMHQNGSVLKVYIPSNAVIGEVDGLSITSSNLMDFQIHGIYPCLNDQKKYIANSAFKA